MAHDPQIDPSHFTPIAEIIPPAPDVPWYHESPSAQLFNEWTWTHFAWGMATASLIPNWWMALLAHTVYEAIEGRIFPVQNRDVSMVNHVGDTVAFMAGRLALEMGMRKRGHR